MHRRGPGRLRKQLAEPAGVQRSWKEYCAGISDNSFYVWQWINLALMNSKVPVKMLGVILASSYLRGQEPVEKKPKVQIQ